MKQTTSSVPPKTAHQTRSADRVSRWRSRAVCGLLLGAALGGLAAPSPAHADMVAHACTVMAAGSAKLEPIREHGLSGRCTGFITRNKEGQIVQIVENGFVGSGSFVVSDDARTVVFIGSYPTLVEGSSHMGWFLTKEERASKKVGVVIYRDRKKTGEYLLADLVGPRERITRSVSHLGWTNWRSLQKQPGDTWTLETEAGVRITFDTRTGEIVDGPNAKSG